MIIDMKGARNSLRPQDILIALKVRLLEQRGLWNQLKLAHELGISPSEVAFSLERLKRHNLLNEDKKSIKRAALVEFLVHGLKYVFPGEVGAPARGIPTGVSFALKEMRVPEDRMIVWPDQDGKVRGSGLAPLYDTVPFAVKNDSDLYQLLALIDVVRLGGARESNIANKQIEQRILNDKE